MIDPLALAQKAAKEIPAYRKFLNGKKLTTWSDVPIMDKKNYIRAYAPQDFFPEKKFPPFAYTSSGSSGTPTLWFRGDREEEIGSILHEPIMRDVFAIDKHAPTLVIVSFYMGMWVAGNYTAAAFRGLARKGYHITTITPGSETSDTLMVLERLAPHFEHVIIAGYPTALLHLLQAAKKRKIALPPKLHLITAGDKAPKALGATFPSLVNIYGSADTGMMAYDGHYDPDYFFFEEIKGELIVTTHATATPLIRYNTHDLGHVLPGNRIELHGRSDVAVTFYSSYLYPEHFVRSLGNRNYFAYRQVSKTGTDSFHIAIEESYRDAEGLAKKLARTNIEYAKVLGAMHAKAVPHLHTVADVAIFRPPKGSEGVLSIRGKKPKMVIY